MESTTQIKNNLISRIQNSNDLSFLKALQTILDASEQNLYPLSSEQEEAISLAREEIKKGNYISNDAVISEMKEWLKSK